MKQEINIITVDDQQLYREGLALVLKSYGIQVIAEAENGEEALKLLATIRPDVVLLDLEMPVLDGNKTLDAIKKLYPDLKVIILSQYNESDLIKHFFNRGVNAYVSKHENIDTLVKAIETVHAGGIFRDNILGLSEEKKVARRKQYKLVYSRREREIIALLCEGKTINEMSIALSISVKTIETHLTEIYKKTAVRGRAEFLIYAIREGLNYYGAETL